MHQNKYSEGICISINLSTFVSPKKERSQAINFLPRKTQNLKVKGKVKGQLTREEGTNTLFFGKGLGKSKHKKSVLKATGHKHK